MLVYYLFSIGKIQDNFYLLTLTNTYDMIFFRCGSTLYPKLRSSVKIVKHGQIISIYIFSTLFLFYLGLPLPRCPLDPAPRSLLPEPLPWPLWVSSLGPLFRVEQTFYYADCSNFHMWQSLALIDNRQLAYKPYKNEKCLLK